MLNGRHPAVYHLNAVCLSSNCFISILISQSSIIGKHRALAVRFTHAYATSSFHFLNLIITNDQPTNNRKEGQTRSPYVEYIMHAFCVHIFVCLVFFYGEKVIFRCVRPHATRSKVIVYGKCQLCVCQDLYFIDKLFVGAANQFNYLGQQDGWDYSTSISKTISDYLKQFSGKATGLKVIVIHNNIS